MSEFLARLSESSRKRVPLEDLKRHYYSLHPEVQNSPDRSARLLEALQQLQVAGVIALPAAGSWEKGGTPALPKWVTLVQQEERLPLEDFSKVPWVPELGFWPELKPAQLVAAKSINDFLLRRRATLTLVPIKERSLQIFGDEKRLDAMRVGNTLFSGRLPLTALGAFQVPLPLPYRPGDAPGKPVLVVENHNSFWSLGEWNHSAKRYAAVVYGAGEAFRSTGGALSQVLREVSGVGAEYLGDLDPKGVGIPMAFNLSTKGEDPQVRPALDLYRWLLDYGIERDKADCALSPDSVAAQWLGPELGARLAVVWQRGRWIPQEALGFEQLLTWRDS